MSEEQTNINETQETTEQTESEEQQDKSSVRSDPLFKKLTSELAETRSQLDQVLSAKEVEAKEAEKARLVEQKKWKELADIAEQEKKELEARFNEELIRRDLHGALIDAGMTNSLSIAGAIAGYAGDKTGIVEYVEELKAKHAPAFRQPGMTPATIPPQGASSAQGVSTSWTQVKADLHSNDRAKVLAANDRIKSYYQKNGSMPPNWNNL